MKLLIQIAFIYIFSLTVANTYAQEIVKVKKKYIHNQKTYDFHSMDEIFKSDPNSYSAYKSAIIARKTSRSFGFLTVGAIGVSVVFPLLYDDADCDFFCFSTGEIAAITIWIIAVPVFTSLALISRIGYNKRRKNAINLFNNDEGVGHLMSPPKWDLRIGGGQYGAGLIVDF